MNDAFFRPMRRFKQQLPDDEALAVEPLRDKLPFTKLRDEILPGLS